MFAVAALAAASAPPPRAADRNPGQPNGERRQRMLVLRLICCCVAVAAALHLSCDASFALTPDESLAWAAGRGASHFEKSGFHELIFDNENRPALTNDDIHNLNGLKESLWKLSMNGRHKVTAEGLEKLRPYRNLRQLFVIDNPSIGDEEVRAIAVHIDQLTTLSLDGTPITDTSLAYLASMRNLRRLAIRNTKVSDAAVTRLQKAKPDLVIYRESD
jgi:hypothetical protein